MAKFTTMLSIWLWIGIFVFLYLYFRSRKEIKKAELDSIHLCIIFTICCFVGFPVAVMEIFNLWEDDEEEIEEQDDENIYDDEISEEEEYDEVIVEYLGNLKYGIDLFLRRF